MYISNIRHYKRKAGKKEEHRKEVMDVFTYSILKNCSSWLISAALKTDCENSVSIYTFDQNII